MPISVTGIWMAKSERGFTLLEVMVVLVIIGIITGFAVLSVNSQSDQERIADIARRLAVIMELNQQEAIILGEQRGMLFSATGYDLLGLSSNGHWQQLEGSALVAGYQLPQDITLALDVEGRPVVFNDAGLPQVLFLSSGEMTDFQLVLSASDSSGYKLSGGITGDIVLLPIQ